MTALLDRHDLRPAKRYGQHFLVDPNIVDRIVRLVESPPGTPVLEIGAGTGVLTAALRAGGHPVLAYEIDPRLGPVLQEVVGGDPSVDLRIEDAADADLQLAGRWAFVANLPYNMGTGMLLDVIRRHAAVSEFVVMVQREVADRLVAQPGTRVYGLPSVVARLFCDARLEFTVPPQVFLPPPRVGSAVVRLARHSDPSPELERAVELAANAFAQRRKMLRSSLREHIHDVDGVLKTAGVDPSRRAEDLAPADYLTLALSVASDV